VYGPIGTLIAFMVWMWLNTLVILLGYELNVSILLGKSNHVEKPDTEPAP
ncbi:MAG: YihY/virulence factor BrkB family protein, partial [Sphingobacteriales bacterium]